MRVIPALILSDLSNSDSGGCDASRVGFSPASAVAPAYSWMMSSDDQAYSRVICHTVFIRTTYFKGFFSMEDVMTHATDFPFDVHYPSIVIESWEESDTLVFVPSPTPTLDDTSDIPLFPLAEWDLVRGPRDAGACRRPAGGEGPRPLG